MADYVKISNFTAKDSLPSGNSGKIVKGAEIDTELTAIASAISSKADTNSPALTGTPTAPTASVGTNTTQVATTAFVTAALQGAYPVGSIYMNATNSQNPSTLLGFGTWTAFGAGRMMVGFNASDALFDSAEETGGSKDAVVVSHTHTATVIDPGHAHNANSSQYSIIGAPGSGSDNLRADFASYSYRNLNFPSATTGISVSNSTVGSSGTNANLPPYITVYIWKRVS